MEWLTEWNALHWLIFGLILLIGEIIIPGVFLIWWGAAAFIVALLNFIFQFPIAINWILFATSAGISSFLAWRYQRNKISSHDSNANLNQRGIAMIGKVGEVVDIYPNHIGRARFGDTTWRITGENLTIGDMIEVISVEDITLTVKKLDAR